MNNSSPLINDVEKRFEVLLTISIFFPVLMTEYFNLVGWPSKDHHEAFIFFPLVGIYIGAYVFFQLSKLFHPLRLALQILNWALLAGIASFALPTIFTVVAEGPIPMSQISFQTNMIAYMGSMYGIMILPFTIFWFTFTCIFLEMFASISEKSANRRSS